MATPTTLPAAFVSGAILTADQMNNMRGAFRVLQIIEGTTSTAVSKTNSTYGDTGLTATITPSATTSKILVIAYQNGLYKNAGNSSNSLGIQILRGATQIAEQTYIGFQGSALQLYPGSVTMVALDSPASVAAQTYKTQFKNMTSADGVTVQDSSMKSSIILFEISA